MSDGRNPASVFPPPGRRDQKNGRLLCEFNQSSLMRVQIPPSRVEPFRKAGWQGTVGPIAAIPPRRRGWITSGQRIHGRSIRAFEGCLVRSLSRSGRGQLHPVSRHGNRPERARPGCRGAWVSPQRRGVPPGRVRPMPGVPDALRASTFGRSVRKHVFRVVKRMPPRPEKPQCRTGPAQAGSSVPYPGRGQSGLVPIAVRTELAACPWA